MEGSFSAIPTILALSLLLSVGGSLDIILIVAFKSYRPWNNIEQFIEARVDLNNVIHISKYVATLFVALQIWRFTAGLRRAGSFHDEFPVKPMLFPCQTSHVRMFPKKHGFSYSYLLVGIPVGWKGDSGGMISVEQEDTRPWYQRWLSLKPALGWWTVNGDHYLGRGHNTDGLAGKLREYLETQGVDHKQYAHAYLLTAARFLNYASNPVSVWHLYSAQKELKALVLEVNNTSDERRIYFLEPSSTTLLSKDPNLPNSVRYTGTWNKDFYVSTFNDRAGKYSVAAYDPLFPNMRRTGPVNTTITLSSADSRAMLIARVYSAGQALDPSSMSVWAKIKFLVSWWWVGFCTFFPRTVYEAFRLFARRGVAWVSRPEPRKDTMPRHANALEICIERHFRQYLEHRISSSQHELQIRYLPAGLIGPSSEEKCIIRSTYASSTNSNTIELRILTPLFYTRIVQYANMHTGLLLEAQSNTIEISNPALLEHLDLNFAGTSSIPRFSISAPTTWVYLSLIKNLRSSVPPIPSLETDPKTQMTILPAHTSTSCNSNSGLDIFTALASLLNSWSSTTSSKETQNYLLSVLKILFAERIALGWIEILDFEVFLFRVLAAWLVNAFILS